MTFKRIKEYINDVDKYDKCTISDECFINNNVRNDLKPEFKTFMDKSDEISERTVKYVPQSIFYWAISVVFLSLTVFAGSLKYVQSNQTKTIERTEGIVKELAKVVKENNEEMIEKITIVRIKQAEIKTKIGMK